MQIKKLKITFESKFYAKNRLAKAYILGIFQYKGHLMRAFKAINTLLLGSIIGIELFIGIVVAKIIFYPPLIAAKPVIERFESGVLMTQIFIMFGYLLVFISAFGLLFELVNALKNAKCEKNSVNFIENVSFLGENLQNSNKNSRILNENSQNFSQTKNNKTASTPQNIATTPPQPVSKSHKYTIITKILLAAAILALSLLFTFYYTAEIYTAQSAVISGLQDDATLQSADFRAFHAQSERLVKVLVCLQVILFFLNTLKKPAKA